MQSFAELLLRWPSLAQISAELGVPYDTVIAWKRRNSVPYEYWTALVASAQQNEIRGLSMEVMAEAAEVLRRERRTQRRAKRAKRAKRKQKTPSPSRAPQDAIRV